MSDNDAQVNPVNDPVIELRTRSEALERQLAAAEQQAEARLIRAELKVEAVRAGMVDLDGLKLLDLSKVKLNAAGEVEDAALLMTQFRRAKPWLFANPSSSSPASVPPAQPPRQKLATEMTDEEYRTARAAVLKHRP
jgi:hypothetical protein